LECLVVVAASLSLADTKLLSQTNDSSPFYVAEESMAIASPELAVGGRARRRLERFNGFHQHAMQGGSSVPGRRRFAQCNAERMVLQVSIIIQVLEGFLHLFLQSV